MIIRWLTAMALSLSFAGSALAGPVNTGHLTAELVAETSRIAPGQTIHIALRQDILHGWHTYWRNPGDSGEAPRLTWTLPPGWRAGAFVWPAPRRLPVGPLVNYGYEGEVLLPMALTAPADLKPGTIATLRASATILVCAELCVPERADLELTLPVADAAAPADAPWAGSIRQALAQAPRQADFTATFQQAGLGLALAVAGQPLKGADAATAQFFPDQPGVIDHAAGQAVERGPEGLTLKLAPPAASAAGAQPSKLAGVLVIDGRAYEIAARPGAPPAGASGPGAPVAGQGGAAAGLPGALVLALLGGLILNLMPCVFPVLAMKAASFASHGGEPSEARRQALAFGAGVLGAFALLAAALIGLRAAGAAIGWGFQLQSPPVVAGLSLLMLTVALNLSGLFEVSGSLQNVGAGLASRRGLPGAVFTGALAVVVAAPCTAPFMGPALGWALTQPAASAMAVFLALAAGFAAPFIALAFIPGLVARLPRPGPWMDVFRRALAFPMYAAAAWLAWVLTVQAGEAALARLLAAAVVVALAAWLAGAAQRRAGQGAPQALAAGVLALAAVAVAVGLPYAAGSGGARSPTVAELPYEPYTPERLAALQAEGKTVLVNYTAAWCVSCQVNDRLALSTKRVAEALRTSDAVYLKADWTRRDSRIAADLARFGRAGVPLYLVYGAKGEAPEILPAILTEGLVVRALATASARGGRP